MNLFLYSDFLNTDPTNSLFSTKLKLCNGTWKIHEQIYTNKKLELCFHP
jgi:hypothetical protein